MRRDLFRRSTTKSNRRRGTSGNKGNWSLFSRPSDRPDGNLHPLFETLEGRQLLASDVVISEFMAANAHVRADQDGDFSDWVEIHNTTNAAVNLDGWYLTDDPANPNKWRFPAVEIAAGGYQIVFASDKNRAVPGQELHSNFRLSAGGEYLALVEPDGVTVATQFSPQFPAQIDDVSYGSVPAATVLVKVDADVRYHVPTSGSLGTSWTDVAFNDSTWSSGSTGIGYDTAGTAPAAIAYWNFDDNALDSSNNNHLLDLAGTTFSSDVPATIGGGKSLNLSGAGQYAEAKIDVSETAYALSLWFKTSTPDQGIYSVTRGNLGSGGHDRDVYLSGTDIAARVYNNETIKSSGKNYADGQWHHLVHVFRQGSLGQRIYIDGVQVASGTKQASAFADQTEIQIGFALDAVNDYFQGQIDDVAIYSTALTTTQIAALFNGGAPQALSYSGQIDSDLRTAMHNKNSSAYARVPFTAADPSVFETLNLRMKYDAGFVAYLNGTEIARRNAPATAEWNSQATASRSSRNAVVFEEIDVTAFRGLLQSGNNVLAIHGLNESNSDSDFLIVPELVAYDADAVSERFYGVPSPGAANNVELYAHVADTKFSVNRGFYDAPFDVTITTTTAGAQIRYTLDGSTPTATTGLVYNGPIHVNKTTTLRAAAFRSGFEPTDVDTQTYLFLDDVIRQSPDGSVPPGWRSSVNGQILDYGMDPDIVNNPEYGPQMKDALKAIPTISLVTDLKHLVDPATGIYVNARGDTVAWERPVSVELINPDGSEGFQINAGLRIRGGFSRDGSNPKHAFRLFFGGATATDGRLNYPLFGDEGADEFAKLDLRCSQNYSWSFGGDGRETHIRELFSRDAHREMGEPYTRTRFYHLYLDGQYWGLYQSEERPEKNYGETYFGGDDDEYDTIKVSPDDGYIIYATDGTMNAWTELWTLSNQIAAAANESARYELYMKAQGLNVDGTRNPDFPVLLDVDNLATYMLITLYGGNLDAPISNFLGNNSPNNWFGLRNRNGDHGFQFFVHDAEHTLLDVNQNRNGPYPAGSQLLKSSPQWIHQQLMYLNEYRLRFADHVQKHMFNGGVLTPDAARQLWMNRANEIDLAVIAESARWGDAKRGSPFTRNDWLNAISTVANSHIPARTNIVINQLRGTRTANGQSAPLFPSLATPAFSQRGGYIDEGVELTLTGSGTIYYTTDGSDPRLPLGGISPTAQVYAGPISITESVQIRVRAKSGADWSPLDEASFAVDTSGFRITEIMYNPAPAPDGSPYQSDDFQYIELLNTTDKALDLNGVRFTNGISFSFPQMEVPAGARVILAKNPQAFASRYGASVVPLGTFTGSLANGGERLRLEDALGAAILDFNYSDDWYPLTDGDGYSLVVVDATAPASSWTVREGWRASEYIDGNPGVADSGLLPGSVFVNELVANGSGAEGDWIELRNASGSDINIGGWYLSDDAADPKKFRIPAGTVIAAGRFLVFNQRDHFGNPANPDVITPFSLDRLGEEIYLRAADGNDVLLGYRDDQAFGIAELDVSFGRHLKSTGGTDFVALTAATPGAENAAPVIGPIVFNEIMFAPLGGNDEYIELRNISGADVQLFDPARPTNVWRFRGGIEFDFPENTVLAAGSYAMVVPIDPATFRTKYNVPASVPIFGPYAGALSDLGEKLELSRPSVPEPSGLVPYVRAEYVNYGNSAPWPEGTTRTGAALYRSNAEGYTNDAGNWAAGVPGGTPGRADGDFSLSVADVFIEEGNSGTTNAVITVTLGEARGQAVTVAYTTLAGTASATNDYTDQSGTLTFGPEETVKSILVPIKGDASDEADETFLIQLSSATNASIARGQATATIIDDDASPDISISNVTVSERDGLITNVIFSVTLSSGSAQVIKVPYATADGTAVGGSDYFAKTGTVTFNPGITSQTVIVSTVGDRTDEDTEEFYVDLMEAEHGNVVKSRGIATIVDNDPAPTVSISGATIAEGDSGQPNAEFQVTLSAESGKEVTVVYSTSNASATAGTDYEAQNATLTIAPGSTSGIIFIPIVADLIDESDETFRVTLSNPVNATLGTAEATGTITDDDDGTVDPPIVTNTNDSGTGSLRAAIQLANASADPPTITFQIAGAGPHVMQLSSALPALTQATTFEIADGQTIEIGTAGNFSLGGYVHLVKSGDGTLVLGGDQSPSSAAAMTVQAGLLNLLSDAGSNVTLVTNGNVNFGASQHLASLTIADTGSASLTAGGGKLLVVQSLSIAGAGRLDLTDNDMVVQATTETREAVLAQVTAALAAGSNGLAWNGPGINSSAAAGNPDLLTALGVMLNDDGLGGPFHSNFSGQAVDTNSVLVKYTYYGDGDLSGVVDGTDYALIDNGNNFGLTGWFNGDFDYDLQVMATDYALIDNVYNTQGSPLSPWSSAPPASTAESAVAPTASSSDTGSGVSIPLAAVLATDAWQEDLLLALSVLNGTDNEPAEESIAGLDDELLELLSGGLDD